jgi:hypothetical protein
LNNKPHSLEEISRLSGMSPGTVWNLQKTAEKKVRKIWRQRYSIDVPKKSSIEPFVEINPYEEVSYEALVEASELNEDKDSDSLLAPSDDLSTSVYF